MGSFRHGGYGWNESPVESPGWSPTLGRVRPIQEWTVWGSDQMLGMTDSIATSRKSRPRPTQKNFTFPRDRLELTKSYG